MTESALAEPREASTFDAVLLTSRAATVRVGGMRLIERCAFVLARAGARRIFCIGDPPADDLRLPAIEIAWLEREDEVPSRVADDRRVVGLDACTVVDSDTITALLDATGAAPLSEPGGRLWRCRGATLPAMIAAARRRAGRDGLAGAHTWPLPEGALLHPVASAAERVEAEDRLLARLGRPDDAWLARVVDRRLSRAMTRRLMHTPIRPNQITALSITIGIIGGLAFLGGTYAATSAGALLFLLSTILDGCDGELARLTHRESSTGARLDIVGDNVVHLVLFSGIAIGLHRVMPANHVAALGATLLLGALAAMASVYVNVFRHAPTAAQRRLYETFAGREFAYLLAGLTVIGRLDLFLWVAAIGIHVFAASLWLLGRTGDARSS